MKKILAIAPYPYLPSFSGGQKLIAKFYDYLGRKTELTVIGTRNNDWSSVRTYRCLPFLRKSFFRYADTSLVDRITKEIRTNQYDCVIWEHPYLAWVAFRVRKKTGIKTIIHTHNIEHLRFRSTGKWWWSFLRAYEKWCFRKADYLFFLTEEDRIFAVRHWKIKNEKCFLVPFGVEIDRFPEDRAACRSLIASRFGIAPEEKIIFFNGLLDYKPNLDALKAILYEINPLLLVSPGFRYKLIICGKRLPPRFDNLKSFAEKNIIYAGFTNEIALFYKAADIFLNPVQSGGGIKTKMVEAIAYGTTVVATQSGSQGIEKNVCGDKLVIVADNAWHDFAAVVIRPINEVAPTPQAYYDYYYWGNAIDTMLLQLAHHSAR